MRLVRFAGENRTARLVHLSGSDDGRLAGRWAVADETLVEHVQSIDAKLDRLSASVDERFEQVNRRFEQVDRRFDEVDAALVEQRQYTEFAYERLDARIAVLADGYARLDQKVDTLAVAFARQERKLDRLIDVQVSKTPPREPGRS
jgi:chromosome segregation ATPase